MLAKAKGHAALILLATSLFVILAVGLAYTLRNPNGETPDLKYSGHASSPADSNTTVYPEECEEGEDGPVDLSCLLTEEQHAAVAVNMQKEHLVLNSSMTEDRQRFLLDFREQDSYNPNIIPHPYRDDTWFIIAQRSKNTDDNARFYDELVCKAQFVNNSMKCDMSPLSLPIAATVSPDCHEDLEYFNDWVGPHDARVFHGPDKPYIIYGSQSNFNCLGLWIQDFRRIVDWGSDIVADPTQRFFWPTNLQRPPPYNRIEKNWFVFWDCDGEMYLHHDLTPQRVFTLLHNDGSVGENLAPAAEASDVKCMDKLMPKLLPTKLEWIHQATNSLLVTMCERSDPSCEATPDNTYLMFMFQVKTFYMHGMYEPYIMMFKQTPPFEVHGISSDPFWYSGRGEANGTWVQGGPMPKDQSEMIFTVAFAWKEQGLTYHGYLDDKLFITFGIEDARSGAIDVLAKDLLSNIALCDDVK